MQKYFKFDATFDRKPMQLLENWRDVVTAWCEGHYPGSDVHRRTGQHPFGGADRVLPEWIQWGGGGGSSRNFPGSIFCGVAEFFR